MTMHSQMTVSLGELVAAAFDEAAGFASDPEARARLATRAVRQMLRQSARIDQHARASARAEGRQSRMRPEPMQAAI